jgi:hypothetical protein
MVEKVDTLPGFPESPDAAPPAPTTIGKLVAETVIPAGAFLGAAGPPCGLAGLAKNLTPPPPPPPPFVPPNGAVPPPAAPPATTI